MPTNIGGTNREQRLNAIEGFTSREAESKLQELKAQIHDGSGGVKSGVFRLSLRDGETQFRRTSWWQFRARDKAEEQAEEIQELIAKLVDKAYGSTREGLIRENRSHVALGQSDHNLVKESFHQYCVGRNYVGTKGLKSLIDDVSVLNISRRGADGKQTAGGNLRDDIVIRAHDRNAHRILMAKSIRSNREFRLRLRLQISDEIMNDPVEFDRINKQISESAVPIRVDEFLKHRESEQSLQATYNELTTAMDGLSSSEIEALTEQLSAAALDRAGAEHGVHFSSDDFAKLLTRMYPRCETLIEQLLAPTNREESSLTRETISNACLTMSSRHGLLYRREYPSTQTSDEAKLNYDDKEALKTLKDRQTIQTVCDVSSQIADIIGDSPGFKDSDASAFVDILIEKKSHFPVHKNALKTGDVQIQKLSSAVVRQITRSAAHDAMCRQAAQNALLTQMQEELHSENQRPQSNADSENNGDATALARQIADVAQTLKDKKPVDVKDKRVGERFKGFMDAEKKLQKKAVQDTVKRLLNPSQQSAEEPSDSDRKIADTIKKERKRLAIGAALRTKNGLVAYLRNVAESENADRQVELLSALVWLPKLICQRSNNHRCKEFSGKLDTVYEVYVKPSKQHDDLPKSTPDRLTRKNTFGNTRITSSLMNNVFPHQKEREAVQLRPNHDAKLSRFLNDGAPYISGYSGMTNLGSKLFLLVDQKPDSDQGKKYIQALTSFIVGAGEHSFPETYQSLNYSLNVIADFHESANPADSPSASVRRSTE